MCILSRWQPVLTEVFYSPKVRTEFLSPEKPRVNESHRIPVASNTRDRWTAVSITCQADCQIGNPWNGGAPDHKINVKTLLIEWL